MATRRIISPIVCRGNVFDGRDVLFLDETSSSDVTGEIVLKTLLRYVPFISACCKVVHISHHLIKCHTYICRTLA